MNIRLYLLFFFIINFQIISAQESAAVQKAKTLKGSFIYFMPDDLGNVFALTASGQLKKYNSTFDSTGVFNEIRRYGRLHSISAENPLRSLLFFKEFRTILVLDRMMQVVNKIDLRKAQIFQVQAVAQSYDNMIWVFDEQESKIKKIDDEGKLVFESVDLRLIFSDAITPSTIFDMGGYLYLYDSEQGLFIFDYYGALKNRIALLGWQNVQPFGKGVVGIKEKLMQLYVPNTVDIKSLTLPEEIISAEHIKFGINGCYIMNAEGVSWYTWKNK